MSAFLGELIMANRSKRVRALKLVAGLLAMSLVAAACGDSGTSTNAGESTTTAPPATTVAPATTAGAGTSGANAGTGDSTAENSNIDLTKTVEGAKSGGTLRIGVEAETDGLNPTVNRFAAAAYQMGYAVMEPLFWPDTDGFAVPYLAESSTTSDDGLTFTMKLRPNITFTDGEPLNADAIIADFDALLADALISLAVKPALDLDNPIEKVDDLTVQFNLALPNFQFSAGLTGQLGMPVSPKYLAAAVDDQTLNQMPVGTGPFVMDNRVQDQVTRMVRNDNWWQAEQNGAEVYLDAIEFYPNTDSQINANQLIGGDLDAFGTTNTDAVATIRDEGDSYIRVEDDQGEESFAMMNTTVAPFDDIRVRQAITFATPRNDYVEFVGAGILRPADTMFAPELIWNNPDVKSETDQPERSQALVDSYCADFPENCSGGRVNIELEYSGPSVVQEQIADILSAGWGDFFNVERVVLLQDDHITNVALGNYQIVTWRQFGAADPTSDRVWLACDSIGFLSLNWPRLCNQTREDMLNAQRSTTDLTERVKIWKDLQQEIHDDYVYIFFTRTLWMQAFSANTRNQCGQVSPDGVELLCHSNGSMFNHTIWFDN